MTKIDCLSSVLNNNTEKMTILERLLALPVPDTFTVKDGKQEILRGLTWKTCWDVICSEHWHAILDGDGCVKHKTPHMESLEKHSLSTAEICYDKAIEMGLEKPVKYYLCGLLHDWGKPGTLFKMKKYLTMKGHGIVGDAIIANLWTPAIEEEFSITDQEWGDMCTAIGVHMCGYFPQYSVECGTIHMDTFRLLTHGVRDYLIPLRMADCLALEPYPEEMAKRDAENKILHQTQAEFAKNVMLDIEPKVYQVTHKLKSGALVLLRGTSQVGKTAFMEECVEEMVNEYGVPREKMDIVTRDDHIISESRIHMENPDATEEECRQHYIETKKVYSDKVDASMKADITNGLMRGHIVFVDAIPIMFTKNTKNILPQEALKFFKVAFWFNRGKPLPEDSPEETIYAHGGRTLMNPFNTRCNWMELTSFTENDLTESYFRPHLSIAMSWNGLKRKEIENTVRIISEMI